MKNKTTSKWEQSYVPAGELWTKKVKDGVMSFLYIRAIKRVGYMAFYPEIKGQNYVIETKRRYDYSYDGSNPLVIDILNLWSRKGDCMKDKPITIAGAKRLMTAWDKRDEKPVAVWCPVRKGRYYYTFEEQEARDKANRLRLNPKRGWRDDWGNGKSYSRNVTHAGGHAELSVIRSKDGKTFHWIYYPAPNDDVRADFSDSEFTTPRLAIDAADKYLRDERKKLVNPMIGHNSGAVAIAA